MSNQKGRKAEDRAPSSPAPGPASDKSWQGKDAHAASARPAIWQGETSATSPTNSPAAPWLAA